MNKTVFSCEYLSMQNNIHKKMQQATRENEDPPYKLIGTL